MICCMAGVDSPCGGVHLVAPTLMLWQGLGRRVPPSRHVHGMTTVCSFLGVYFVLGCS